MNQPILKALILTLALSSGAACAGALDEVLAGYRATGAGAFSAREGAALWRREFPSSKGPPRSCTSCHTSDTRRSGRHAVTKKVIDPIAPSVNSKRLTKRKEIVKWLRRNCKWTLGRECTPQEKGDLLSFLRTQ